VTEKNLTPYLMALKVGSLFAGKNRKYVILHEHLKKACERSYGAGYDVDDLTGRRLEHVVGDIMRERGIYVVDKNIGAVGLEKSQNLGKLIAELTDAILKGVRGDFEKERFYEMVVEELINYGDVDDFTIEQLKKLKGQKFAPSDEGYKRYERELEEERQRIQADAALAKQA